MKHIGTAILILATAACSSVSGIPGQHVAIEYQPVWVDKFQTGTVPKHGVTADHGKLDATVYTPAGTGPFPFVVLLHGTAPLSEPETYSWAVGWSKMFTEHGYGVLVLDSFKTRGVSTIFGHYEGWAEKRTDDAYSALEYLGTRPDVNTDRIYLMGMSNGGTTTLAAILGAINDKRPHHFAAAIAEYPDCVWFSRPATVPLLIIHGTADDWTSPKACQTYIDKTAGTMPRAEIVLISGATHAFDEVGKPHFSANGHHWIVYDARATETAQQKAIEFLTAH